MSIDRSLIRIAAIVAMTFWAWQGSASAQSAPSPAAVVQSILSAPDDQLDYARAKLAFDRIVDPSVNVEATLAQIDRLARAADVLAGPGASSAQRLSALRRVIYESGEWNGGHPFSYDHADPLGRNVRNKLISTYLRTRRGNCVSMPILFLLVGERMGLHLALSTAPLHIFLRYTDESEREINLEATSGGLRRGPYGIARTCRCPIARSKAASTCGR
jgi:regulator of sirC expression with transglutaminase-like and TPR domain